MAVVLFEMGNKTLINWQSIVIVILAFGLVFGLKKANPIQIVLDGSILGYGLHFF